MDSAVRWRLQSKARSKGRDKIPMTPLAYRELQAWWMRQGQPGGGVVFPAEARTGGDEEGYASRSAYRRALATA
jgi:hypothetical protein